MRRIELWIFWLLLGFGALLVSSLAPGRDKKDPPIPSYNLTLTKDEATQLELLSTKEQNRQLRLQLIQQQVRALSDQIQAEGKQLEAEKSALTDVLAKAHGIDLAKFKLDDKAAAFVPIDKPIVKAERKRP